MNVTKGTSAWFCSHSAGDLFTYPLLIGTDVALLKGSYGKSTAEGLRFLLKDVNNLGSAATA